MPPQERPDTPRPCFSPQARLRLPGHLRLPRAHQLLELHCQVHIVRNHSRGGTEHRNARSHQQPPQCNHGLLPPLPRTSACARRGESLSTCTGGLHVSLEAIRFHPRGGEGLSVNVQRRSGARTQLARQPQMLEAAWRFIDLVLVCTSDRIGTALSLVAGNIRKRPRRLIHAVHSANRNESIVSSISIAPLIQVSIVVSLDRK